MDSHRSADKVGLLLSLRWGRGFWLGENDEHGAAVSGRQNHRYSGERYLRANNHPATSLPRKVTFQITSSKCPTFGLLHRRQCNVVPTLRGSMSAASNIHLDSYYHPSICPWIGSPMIPLFTVAEGLMSS